MTSKVVLQNCAFNTIHTHKNITSSNNYETILINIPF